MPKTLRVYCVAVAVDTGEAIQAALRLADFDPILHSIATLETFATELTTHQPDIIFCARSSPRITAQQILTFLKQAQLDIPLIVLGRQDDDETQIVPLIRRGAADYVRPGRLVQIGNIVQAVLNDSNPHYQRQAAVEKPIQWQEEHTLLNYKREFLSLVTHEFRAPLTLIGSSGQMLKYYGDRLDAAKQMEHLNRIEREVNYIASLLDDVTLFNQATSEKLEFHPANTDLLELCAEVIDQIGLSEAGDHVFTFTHSGDLRAVWLDAKLIRHILTNLLSNAVKYTETGGRVHLDITRGQNDVTLRVDDSGIGIPPDSRARLFQPFYRAENVGKIKGTGLGLTLVKLCAEAHGGAVDYESEVGQGTTFTVWLPLK